jgi:hypothetical protein
VIFLAILFLIDTGDHTPSRIIVGIDIIFLIFEVYSFSG